MNETQKKIVEALKGLGIPNYKEYDAHMVTAWYNEYHKENVSVRMIAQQLDGCPLPRRRLDTAQEWAWFKETGNRAWYLYQNRQTGPYAYLETQREYEEREERSRVARARKKWEAEKEKEEQEKKRKAGEWYEDDPD